MRRRGRLMYLTFASLGFLLATGGEAPPAVAQEAPSTISIAFEEPLKPGLAPHLTANVVGEQGQPIPEARVRFFREVEFVGTRLSFLGEGMTDAAGTARIIFNPQIPTYRIVARAVDVEGITEAEFAADISVPESSLPTNRPGLDTESLLEPLQRIMPRLLALLVLLVWVLLLGTTFLTVRGIRREARGKAVEGRGLSDTRATTGRP